jgi:opacity protein-like surface antigen
LRLTILAPVGLALLLSGSLTHAADLLPPAPVLDDADEPSDSGWYLRGDIGALDGMASRDGRDVGFGLVPPSVRSRFERSFSIGGGLGYQALPWFRADVTVDHRFETTFRETRLAFGAGSALDRADYGATTVLLNAYLDLALVPGFTPYLGGGIGFSHSRLGEAERWSYGAAGDVTGVTALGSRSNTAFAWAVTTGVAVDVTGSLKLDLGYRYTDLGDGATHAPMTAAPLRADEIRTHEVRVSARYLFN